MYGFRRPPSSTQRSTLTMALLPMLNTLSTSIFFPLLLAKKLKQLSPKRKR
jgi:hypothetical protein